MKTLIVSAAAIAAAALFVPTPSNAQIGFGVPGFGVQIGGGPYGGYGGGPYRGYGGAPYYGGYGYQQPYYGGGYRPYGYGEGVVVQPRSTAIMTSRSSGGAFIVNGMSAWRGAALSPSNGLTGR